jgi:hypothetical protein
VDYAPGSRADVTLVDLEFDTGTRGAALLGDVASSLVSVDELLRDLASLAADPSSAEFRNIEIIAIEMRSPLKVRLSLYGISPGAISAFQQICRDIILSRDRGSAATLSLSDDLSSRLNEHEAKRLSNHIDRLQHAAIPLKRVEVKAG